MMTFLDFEKPIADLEARVVGRDEPRVDHDPARLDPVLVERRLDVHGRRPAHLDVSGERVVIDLERLLVGVRVVEEGDLDIRRVGGDLDDLALYARVVEAGGFTAAGRASGIPKSRLSRRIAALEERLARLE